MRVRHTSRDAGAIIDGSDRGMWARLLTRVIVRDFDEPPQGYDGLQSQSASDIDEFDHTEAPLTALVFGDERLRLIESRGNVGLGQATLLPQVTQQLAELDLARRAQRVAHCGKPGFVGDGFTA